MAASGGIPHGAAERCLGKRLSRSAGTSLGAKGQPGEPTPGSARNDPYRGRRWRALGCRAWGEFGAGTHACRQAAGAAEAGVAWSSVRMKVSDNSPLVPSRSVNPLKNNSTEKAEQAFSAWGRGVPRLIAGQLATAARPGLLPAPRAGVSGPLPSPAHGLGSSRAAGRGARNWRWANLLA